MHELSLAQSVVQIVAQESRQAGLGRVTVVRLRIGALRGVVPELLRTGLEVMGRGTVLDEARVEIERVPGQARCPGCGLLHEIEEILFLCPGCGRVGGEIVAGQDLQVIEIEGE